MAKFPLLSSLFGRTSVLSRETSHEDGGMAVVAQADAIATGEDTYTAVKSSVTIVDNGKVTFAGGRLSATAAAESPDGKSAFADAETGVAFEGADIVVTLGLDRSGGRGGSSYDYSSTMFRALDLPFYDGPTKVIDLSVDMGKWLMPFHVDGNVAKADFDIEARGENTLADVDAFALAVEDQLSISTTVSTAATG